MYVQEAIDKINELETPVKQFLTTRPEEARVSVYLLQESPIFQGKPVNGVYYGANKKIYVNANRFNPAVRYTIIHELGHFIGFREHDCPPQERCLMECMGKQCYEFSPSERRAIRLLYSRNDRFAKDYFEGCM